MTWNPIPTQCQSPSYITNANPFILMGHEEPIGYIKTKIAMLFICDMKQNHGMKSVITIDTSIYDDTGAARS